MLAPETNRALFDSAPADMAIVEGVMGLFDGSRGSDIGSTAAMAKHLELPVLLVVDASHMAASVAALVRGFETFDRDVRIVGVVLNRVGTTRHYELLRDALIEAGCAPAVGHLPSDASIRIPERHLGLHTAGEDVWSDATIEHLASQIERFIDLDEVLRLAALDNRATPDTPADRVAPREASGATARIAVARDQAFCFYYQDNVDALRAAGAEIVEFSPLTDRMLPHGTTAVYIGGGYPELHAETLAANEPMRAALRDFATSGGPIYAECGGLMYLASRLHLSEGAAIPMVGLLPFETRMTSRLVRFGYVDVRLTADCLLGPAGTTARGHSFHYSTIEPGHAPLACAYHLRSTLSGQEAAEGYVLGNVLASYVHLHFLSNPTLATSFVQAARGRA